MARRGDELGTDVREHVYDLVKDARGRVIRWTQPAWIRAVCPRLGTNEPDGQGEHRFHYFVVRRSFSFFVCFVLFCFLFFWCFCGY